MKEKIDLSSKALNVKEKKIIFELSKDCRISASKIAKKCQVSKETVLYTIKKFENSGLIKKFVTLIDVKSLNYTRYELYVKFSCNKTKKDFIKYALDNKVFMWVREALGNFEVLSEFYAKNIEEYDKIINNIRTKLAKDITLETSVVLEEHSFPLKCINYFMPEIEVSKKSTDLSNVDSTDIIILRKIADDAKINATKIAKEAKLGIDATIYRIKKLKENKIIYGYRVVVDESKLGFEKYKITLKLVRINEDITKKVIGFLNLDQSTQYVKRCVGAWDFSITVIVRSTKELKEFIDRIQDLLKENIQLYTIMPLFTEYKNTYFPVGLNNNYK